MKTLKQVEIKPVYVEFVPDKKDMEFGKLYISERYGGCAHLCLCGCGEHTFISLKSFDGNGTQWKDGWSLIKESNGTVSLTPSLLHRFDCKSHYIITKNKANFV